MAIVPRYQESVAPNTSDLPLQNPQGDPRAFGGGLGEAVQQAGQTSGQIGDELHQHALAMQQINNKMEADKAFQDQLTEQNLYVEQWKQDNPGFAASKNLPQALQQLESMRGAREQAMSTPLSKLAFAEDSRRYLGFATSALSTYAAEQWRTATVHQSAATMDALVSDMVLNTDHFSANVAKMGELQGQIDHVLGATPEEGALHLRQAYGHAVSEVVSNMQNQGDIKGAAAFLDAHKEGMDGKMYTEALGKLRAPLMADSAAGDAQQAIGRATSGLGSNIGQHGEYASRVAAFEGTTKNPNSSADGYYQFTGKIVNGQGKGTLFDVIKQDPGLAAATRGLTPQQILDKRHDPQFMEQVLAAEAQQNTNALLHGGIQPKASNVGLAHFLGAPDAMKVIRASDANDSTPVSKILSPQVIAANPVLQGKTARQVVQMAQAKFETGLGNTSGVVTSADLQGRMQSALDEADRIAEAKYPGNDTYKKSVEQNVMAFLNRQIDGAKGVEYQAYTTLGNAILQGKIETEDQLYRTVPNAAALMATLPLGEQTALRSDMKTIANQWSPTRQANMDLVNGLYGGRNNGFGDAFLKEDIAGKDLPLEYKIDMLKKQNEFRNAPHKAAQDKFMSQLQTSFDYKQLAYTSLKLRKGSSAEAQLLGAIQSEYDVWRANNPNTAPDHKTIMQFMANASHAVATNNYFFGMNMGPAKKPFHAYHIEDDDRKAAKAYLQSKGHVTDEEQVSRYIHETQRIRQEFQRRGFNATDQDVNDMYEKNTNG